MPDTGPDPGPLDMARLAARRVNDYSRLIGEDPARAYTLNAGNTAIHTAQLGACMAIISVAEDIHAIAADIRRIAGDVAAIAARHAGDNPPPVTPPA